MAPKGFDRVTPGRRTSRKSRRVSAISGANGGIFHKSPRASDAADPASSSTRGRPPPTACLTTGHVLTRVMKDVFPRYKVHARLRRSAEEPDGTPTACRWRSRSRKELRITGKEAIVAYGVEPFVRRCLDSVFHLHRGMEAGHREARVLVGSWMKPTSPITRATSRACGGRCRNSIKRGLLYRDYKVVWWWAQGGTVLSAAEVGEGYRRRSTILRSTSAFRLLDDPKRPRC